VGIRATTYILVRVFLASVFLIVFEVFALDFVVFGFGFGFFVVDFFGWLGLGLALFGFGSCSVRTLVSRSSHVM
jgi:hypothetical protein